MVHSQHALALEALQSTPHPLEQLKSVRYIKNLIIGNRSKKDLFVSLGIIPSLIQFLQADDLELKVQSAVVLGSLAYGQDANVLELANQGAIPILFRELRAPNTSSKHTEAVARALKCIYSSPRAPKAKITQQNLLDLVALIQSSNIRIAELCASVLARICDGKEQQMAVADAGAIKALVRLLASGHSKANEAALDAISSVCRQNEETADMVVKEDPIPLILRLIQERSPTKRLLAATCLTNLYRVGVIPQHQSEISLTVLPILVKLLSERTHPNIVQGKAPLILAYLVSENEQMQKSACDLHAIAKLSEILHHSQDNDRLKESALLAIAAISSLREECRKQVVEAKVLPLIVEAMSNPSTGVRAAACHCTRSLSRSVKSLWTNFADAGIDAPLFKLLKDESVSVQTFASATLCNIVLEFSPMKKSVLDNGCIPTLVSLVTSMDTTLRLNSIWALKNLLFQAQSPIKDEVMKQLGYEQLQTLLDDPDIGIQEQAMNLLRNLACGHEYDIEEVFEGMGEERLFDILTRKLESHNDDVVMQTLYAISNIATGKEVHKAAILRRSRMLQSILHCMTHIKASIRVATMWCVINLTWTEDAGSPERIRHLRQLGFETQLHEMRDDPNPDVRDRLRTALQHFSTSSTAAGSNASFPPSQPRDVPMDTSAAPDAMDSGT